jgi:methyl-accepting chemotaxis protein
MNIRWLPKINTIGFRILLAFFCIFFLVILQGAIALYSSRNVVATQQEAYQKELKLLAFRDKLSHLRIRMFMLLGTLNPGTMDALKAEIEQLFTELTEESEAVNISSETLAASQETYRQIIDLHWDFRTTQGYDLINSTSQEEYEAIYAILESSRGIIESEMQEAISRSNMQFVVVTVLLCCVGLLIVVLWAWYLIRSIADPIKQAVGYATMIADGDLSMDIKAVRTDEAGQLLAAFNAMLSRLKAMSFEIETLTQAVQAGDLSVRGDAEAFAGGWRDLIEGMNTVIDAFVIPISVTAGYIDRIAKGDNPDAIAEEYQGDFNAIKKNLESLVGATRDITRLAEALARGNLLVEVHERSEHDVLMRSLNTMITHIKSAVTNVSDAANSIATMSGQLSSGAEELSNGASEQAASMEESSSSMEEMAANIRQNSDNARQTEKIAVQSMEYAEETGRVVAETVVAMQQIAEKIAIIQDIANQTRMLSLNATIEAARAQDHGKAFSVVAAEVRQLSDTTKEAAEQIDKLAASSLEVSEKAGTMLDTLVPSIRKTTELIMEISAASNEQNTGAEQVNRAIQQADQVTQQNATIAEETASSAEELANQARQLQRTISFFTIEKASRKPASNDKQQKTLSRFGKLKKKMRSYDSKTGHDIEYDHAEPEPDDIPEDASVDDEYDDEFERY